MAINSGFSHYIKMVMFHSYISLPEGIMVNNENRIFTKSLLAQVHHFDGCYKLYKP